MVESNTCLLPMITDRSHTYIRLYRHYKNGLLPLAGGVLEQPNTYLQAMEIIDGAN